MAPSYSNVNPHNGDVYSAYNKPLAVIDYVERFQPAEEWLLILDADMILHLPFVCKARGLTCARIPCVTCAHRPQHVLQGEGHAPEFAPFELPCARGAPISADYSYLVGSTNALALKHLPHATPRNDTAGGQPFGRYADQVGGVFLVHRDDMRVYMHDWLAYTEAVRYDPDVRG